MEKELTEKGKSIIKELENLITSYNGNAKELIEYDTHIVLIVLKLWHSLIVMQ